MEKKRNVNWIEYFKSFGFLFYFVVLIGERLASFILSVMDKSVFNNNITPFNAYVHCLLIVSVILTIVILNKQIVYMIKAAFNNKVSFNKLDYQKIVIASGVLLFSGMVHTNNTFLIVQFVSYAGMIASMLMVALDENKKKENRWNIWLAFSYLVCFAMAIPVAYSVSSKNNLQKFLEFYQCFGSFILVTIFTILNIKYYTNKSEIKINVVPLLVLIAIDAPILILLLEEKGLNFFLLAFPVLTIIAYVWFVVINIKKAVNKK